MTGLSPSDSLIQEPADGTATAALVWLHGLSASAHDFAGLGERLQCPGLRILCLQAPTRAVSLFGGAPVPSWFDIRGPSPTEAVSDLNDLQESTARIHSEFARQQEAGVPRLAIGGYSQGGALALFAALTYREPLAAAICLSGYLPQEEYLSTRLDHLMWRTPYFLGHGQHDEIVPFVYGEASRDWLRQQGATVDWFSGAHEHEVPVPEWEALQQFLQDRF